VPYQLRRIVAINIKNSITRLPTGRVAELDPRGGVLAIGENGVGKTTFLRLLPVFYGATTSQILRGSGRDSLIAYLLPDPSSCVVYEYERETANSLAASCGGTFIGAQAPDKLGTNRRRHG
jgi:energy-coupling factor transporter ATP-binding protein EcfA2